MRLVKAELQKVLTSKTIFILFVALLIFNFSLTLYTSRLQPYEKTVREVYNQYVESPQEIDEYYTELKVLASLSFRDENASIPHIYHGTDEHDDLSILSRVYQHADYINGGYESQISKITKLARRKIDDLYGFNYDETSYEIKSQSALLEKYDSLLDFVESDIAYSYGYDIYLKNNTISIFILLFILVNTSYIFLNDKSIGFDNILRASKQGRGATFSAKLLTVLVCTFGCTVLFHATTFLATAAMQGFSSPMRPIQSFAVFATVPYKMSILKFIFVQVGLRTLGFAIISLVVSLLASLKFSNVICVGGGIVFSAINVFLYSRTYLGTAPAIKHINVYSMIEMSDLLAFYRTLSFFGIPVSYLLALLILSIAFSMIVTILCAIFFCKNIHMPSIQSKKIVFNERIKETIFKLKRYFKFTKQDSKPHSLTFYEFKKNRILLILFAFVIIILGRSVYVSKNIGTMESFDEALYYEYICEVQALDFASRGDYITNERTRINTIINAAKNNKSAFERGEYDADLYYDYLKSLSDAKVKNVAFERVERYVEYIDGKNAATGQGGKIIYSTGYERFFALSSDVLLFTALFILCMRTFSLECESGTSCGGFSQILRTTKRGRKDIFNVKVFPFALIGASMAIAFRAVTLFIVSNAYVLPDRTATLYSVQSFFTVRSNITIGQYLIVDFCIQAVIGAVIAMLICMISLFFNSSLAVVSVGLFVVGIPEVLTNTVLKRYSDFSIISLTSPQNLVSRSASYAIFGNDFSYLAIICLMYMAVCIALTILGQRKFCGFYNSYKQPEEI